jgi:hypothetical protein
MRLVQTTKKQGHIDGILLFDTAISWYIYIQDMEARERSAFCFKALQPMINLGPEDSHHIDHGAYFCIELNLHLKGIFNGIPIYMSDY